MSGKTLTFFRSRAALNCISRPQVPGPSASLTSASPGGGLGRAIVRTEGRAAGQVLCPEMPSPATSANSNRTSSSPCWNLNRSLSFRKSCRPALQRPSYRAGRLSSRPNRLATLKAYAAGARHSGIMQPQAGTLTDAEMRALAAHYAAQDVPVTAKPVAVTTSESSRLGALIARQGVHQDGVPACDSCNGPG